MRKNLRVPHYVVFILVGIAAALYVNRTYEYQAIDLTGVEYTVTPNSALSGNSSADTARSPLYQWAYIQQGVSTNELKPYQLFMPTYSAAGWPLKYYVKTEYPKSPALVFYDVTKLLLNLLIFATVIGIYFGYEQLFGKRESTTKDGAARRRVGLVDLVTLTTLVAFAFAYWGIHSRRTLADEQLAVEIGKAGGTVKRTAIVPEPLAKWLTRAMGKHFFRITYVSIPAPSTELLTKIVNVDSLQFLCLTGGNYDLRALDALPKRTLLAYLQVSGRKLDAQCISTISGCKSLQMLNLMRTNVTAKGLVAIGEMPCLRDLNVVHTDVRLAELTNLPLSKSLQLISLPHGNVGVGDQLTIDSWPEIEYIECFEFDTPRNSTPVMMSIRNCPSLKQVLLDPLQKYELTLENLPNLEMVWNKTAQVEGRIREGETITEMPWLSRIDLNSLPNFKQLSFRADDLESMKFAGVPIMIADLNAGSRSSTDPFLTVALAGVESQTAQEPPNERHQKWIEDLAKSDGPGRVAFRNIPMAGIDITSLANNSGIRALDLSGSGFTDASQLKRLTGLEQLILLGCRIDSNQLTDLAKNLPNLQLLLVSKYGLQQLHLRDMPNLQRLFFDNDDVTKFGRVQRNSMESIELVNLPQLAEEIHTSPNLRSLQLENVTSLKKLSFVSPLPPAATLVGLRDLVSFVGGGTTLSDRQMSEVLNCKQLKKLMIAYASVTPELLKRIGELKELEHLILTGSQVTDEAVASWGEFSGLRTLALNQTQITPASIPWVLRNPKLVSLEIGGSALSAEAFAEISKLTQLKRLSIPGTRLNRGIAFEIGKLISLNELDISGCELTHEAALPLIESYELRSTLAMLKINGGRIDDQALNGLLQNYPNLRFELTDCEAEPRLVDQLIQSGRAIVENNESRWSQSVSSFALSPEIDEVPASNFDPNRPAPQNQGYSNVPFGMGRDSDFSSNGMQFNGMPMNQIPADGQTFNGPSLNILEQLGSWIAEAALAAQPSTQLDRE